MVDPTKIGGMQTAVHVQRTDPYGRASYRDSADGERGTSSSGTPFPEDVISISPEALMAMENDPLFGLSAQAEAQVMALFDQMDAIFADAGDGALTAEQEQQLDALDRKLAALLGDEEVLTGNIRDMLSESGAARFDELISAIDTIYEAAFNAPLSKAQQEQVDELERQLDELVNGELGDDDPFSGLSSAELKQLDQLFARMDMIFAKSNGEDFTKEQEQMLKAIEQKADAILDRAGV